MHTSLAAGLLDLIYYHVVIACPDDGRALAALAQLVEDLTDAVETITLYGLDHFTSSIAEAAGAQLTLELA